MEGLPAVLNKRQNRVFNNGSAADHNMISTDEDEIVLEHIGEDEYNRRIQGRNQSKTVARMRRLDLSLYSEAGE